MKATDHIVNVFISSSHKDEKYKNDLLDHLSTLVRSRTISVWSDNVISVGDKWEYEINEHILTADIIVFLLSPDFFSSEYCVEKEVEIALEKHKNGEVVIFSVLVRPVHLEPTVFAKFQYLPREGKAISRFRDQDSCWSQIVSELDKKRKLVAHKLRKKQSSVDLLFCNTNATSIPNELNNKAEWVFNESHEISLKSKFELDYVFSKQFPSDSRLQGEISGSFWEKSNRFFLLNRQIKQAIILGESIGGLSEKSFHYAAKSLLNGISYSLSNRKLKFVSTNTMIDDIGITYWLESPPARMLVRETRSILQNTKNLEAWRIFVINRKDVFLNMEKTAILFSMLEENRYMGLRVGVFLSGYLPERFTFHFADYYCVPKSKVLISTTPYYFLTSFSANNEYDRHIVTEYSDLSNYLTDCAMNNNAIFAFEWRGGSISHLNELVSNLN